MAGHTRTGRRAFLGAVALAAAVALAGVPAALGQGTTEKKIDPVLLPLDKPDTWTFHFRYKPPRIKTVDALDNNGKPVKKTVWYMWYQVYNMSGEPQVFLPEFELVTKDLNTTHLDEPQPYVFEQLKKFEDPPVLPEFPNGILNLQNTITVSKRPVPPSKPDAIPRMVSGLAIWTDMAEKAPGTNKFTVYVSGLSNGLAIEEKPETGERLIKRKTLQINFVRPTDDKRPQITDIVPDDASGPAEKWIYRTVSSVKVKKP